MKKKLFKVLASILVLSFLLSCFAVLTFAETEGTDGEEGEEEEGDPMNLYFYRDFGEGWEMNNGLSNAGGKQDNNHLAYEVTDDFQYNYYLNCDTFGDPDAFLTLNTPATSEHVTLQFDIKLKDYMSIGQILYTRVQSGTGAPTMGFAGIQNACLMLPAEGSFESTQLTKNAVPLSDDWVHVAYQMTFDTDPTTASVIGFEIYYGFAKTFDIADPSTYTKYNTMWIRGSGYEAFPFTALEMFRLGFITTTANGAERSYCIDNLALYTGVDTPKNTADVAAYGYGSFVNAKASKSFPILHGTGSEKTIVQYINESLVMKVGVEYTWTNEERRAILTSEDGVAYGAPAKVDGKVMVALQPLLDHIGYPVYIHPDGVSYDISTPNGCTYLTVGRANASASGERVELTAAPVVLSSEYGDYVAIALDDIEGLFPGYYVTYDDLGFIVIGEIDDVYNRYENLAEMVKLMKNFVFDFPTGEQVYADVKANTDNFTHPYLLAKQDKWDEMNEVYEAYLAGEEYDEEYFKYINKIVATGKSYYNGYSKTKVEDGDYIGIKESLYTPDPSLKTTVNKDSWFSQNYLLYNIYESRFGGTNYGYDPDGGRNNLAPGVADRIMYIAATYQITRDERFAELAYDLLYQMCTWETWGEGHFLNCADATGPMAEAFDWCYNVWRSFEDDAKVSKTFDKAVSVDTLAQGLYDLGLAKGYVSAYGQFTLTRLTNGKQTISGYYTTSSNNWNAVCTSGMMLGSLALLEYCDDEGTILVPNAQAIQEVKNSPETTAAGQIFKLIEGNMKTLAMNGMDEYAPDGAYIESPGYWSYGTNSFFEMIQGFMTAANDDYGYMDCWGIDTTCYFALQTEFPLGSTTNVWAYHDSGSGAQAKDFFYFVGNYFGDEGLIAVRRQQIEEGTSSYNIFDALGFKPEYETLDASEVGTSLDYWGSGIDLVCSRSTWDRGCIYTGYMGARNDCSHNDVDAGTFIYNNYDYQWFVELGSEQYNTYNYFGSAEWRNSYYRKGGEGQNHVIITSQQTNVRYGQLSTGTGSIESYLTNEFGISSTMDVNTCFGNYVNNARRGLLFTNDRSTVVVQDEIAFKGVESFAWIAHTKANITLSDDARTAYLTANTPYGPKTIRVSIVSTISKYVFEVMDCYTFLLDTTIKPGKSLENGGVDEYSRTDINRLVITGSGNSFELAIVIEEVDDMQDTKKVGYTWTKMDDWEPVESFNGTDGPVDPSEKEERVTEISDVRDFTREAGRYVEREYAFTTRLPEFFESMHIVDTALTVFNINAYQAVAEIYNAYLSYLDYLDEYEAFQKDANRCAKADAVVADALSGYLG